MEIEEKGPKTEPGGWHGSEAEPAEETGALQSQHALAPAYSSNCLILPPDHMGLL